MRLLVGAALVAVAAVWLLGPGRAHVRWIEQAWAGAAQQVAQESQAWMREEGAQAAVRVAEQAAERVQRELGALAARPEAGALLARRLIDALVTDAPSPGYVDAVARVYDDNGRGERGDMRAVVHAMLIHPEAEAAARQAGSLKEPLVRAAAALLARPVAQAGQGAPASPPPAATPPGAASRPAPTAAR